MAGAIRLMHSPPACLTIASTGPFGERISNFLAAGRPGCREISAHGSELTNAFADSSMVVLALWRPDQELCESTDALSFQHQVPWLPVIMEHPVIRVGPMIRPPFGPCFGCYARRRLQHDRDSWASAVLGWAYAADHAWGPGGYLPHHARLAAALTRDVINRPAVRHQGLVADEVTTIRLLTGGFHTRPVIACPGCDRCEPAAPPGRPDWLREVSARARADVGRSAADGSRADGRDRVLAAP